MQRQTHEVLNYNVQASRTLANGMGRVESLLQQLVDIQTSNLRSTLRQSGRKMPVTHPSQAADEEQGLEYVEEPDPEPAPAPIREQYRVHFADRVSIAQDSEVLLPDDEEMAILIKL